MEEVLTESWKGNDPLHVNSDESIDCKYGAMILYVLFTPFVIGPLVFSLIVLISGAHILIYKIFYGFSSDYSQACWGPVKNKCCFIFKQIATIWHGYEVEGIEQIKKHEETGALIISHHGTMMFDFLFFMAHVALRAKTQKIRVVSDHFMFRIPIFRDIITFGHSVPGTYSQIVDLLKQGNFVLLSPGGVFEAQFTNDYEVLWRKRTGFARAALEAKAPIIPYFTKNCKEAFRNLYLFKKFSLWLYEKTRLPTVPMYGGFPVKLKTYLGEPIPYDPKLTPEELAAKTIEAVKVLIEKNQRMPGSIIEALKDRFSNNRKPKIT